MHTNTNTTNPATLTIISAIRTGYRLAGILPSEIQADLVCETARAWRSGDMRGVVSALGQIQLALGNVEGAWDAWRTMRDAVQAAAAAA